MINNLKCYISASPSSYKYIGIFKDALRLNGIDTYDIYDTPSSNTIDKTIRELLNQCDFAIFILTEPSPNELFEIGLCAGLGKPYFIFLERGLEVPFDLQGRNIEIRRNFESIIVIREAIEAILSNVRSKSNTVRNRNTKTEKKKTLSKNTYSERVISLLKTYNNKVENLRRSGLSGREVEEIASDIFKVIGQTFVENKRVGDTGVDFAIWSDRLEKLSINPILIEIKSGNISSSRFDKVKTQLYSYIGKTDAKVGILLYLDNQGRRYKIDSKLSPLVLSFDFGDFLNELTHNSFEEIIVGQRNKIAHGLN